MTNRIRKVFIFASCFFLIMELGMAMYSHLFISPEAVVHNLVSVFGWVVWIFLAIKLLCLKELEGEEKKK